MCSTSCHRLEATPVYPVLESYSSSSRELQNGLHLKVKINSQIYLLQILQLWGKNPRSHPRPTINRLSETSSETTLAI
ncbi:hypothetical protein M405DRAFT_806019 [Rhizopogon salebrosus TDB-379]|nr:hypothetical protein M405DRAFT_806019 [Rhizopogon salebrosus TDB-379]